MEFRCECGRKLRAPETATGRRGRCPACGAIFTVPAPAEAAAPEPELIPVAGPHASPFDAPAESGDEPDCDDGEIPLAPAAYSPPPRPSPSIYAPPPRVVGSSPAVVMAAPAARTIAARAPQPVLPLEQGDTRRGYLYWVLILVLIPLVVATFHKSGDEGTKLEDRLIQTIKRHPEARAAVKNLSDDADLDDVLKVVLAAVPGHKLDGAVLPRDTIAHWILAGLSGAAFIGAVLLLFPHGHAKVQHLASIGLFTGTIGILLLLGFQLLAAFMPIFVPRSLLGIILDVIALIGYSYQLTDGRHGFLVSFLGFTAGVGFCEEVCKALPLVFRARSVGFSSWRSAMLWGLISGAGFGVSEGIHYASSYYNGIAGAEAYWVRFVSCVGLHAIWSASVGITIFHQQDIFRGEMHPLEWISRLLQVVVMAMLLHGLYDTFLTHDYQLYALLVAFASFGWLAFQIEHGKRKYDDTGLGAAMA
jgi:RsiW-degrading membrane proteinase PrsW (M82 family)